MKIHLLPLKGEIRPELLPEGYNVEIQSGIVFQLVQKHPLPGRIIPGEVLYFIPNTGKSFDRKIRNPGNFQPCHMLVCFDRREGEPFIGKYLSERSANESRSLARFLAGGAVRRKKRTFSGGKCLKTDLDSQW